MTIVVLGCDHEMQPNEEACDLQLQSERQLFRDTVSDFINRYAVEFIAEEAKWDCTTSTCDLARERGIRYEQIDI